MRKSTKHKEYNYQLIADVHVEQSGMLVTYN